MFARFLSRSCSVEELEKKERKCLLKTATKDEWIIHLIEQFAAFVTTSTKVATMPFERRIYKSHPVPPLFLCLQYVFF